MFKRLAKSFQKKELLPFDRIVLEHNNIPLTNIFFARGGIRIFKFVTFLKFSFTTTLKMSSSELAKASASHISNILKRFIEKQFLRWIFSTELMPI